MLIRTSRKSFSSIKSRGIFSILSHSVKEKETPDFSNSGAKTFVGTLHYCPPEIFNANNDSEYNGKKAAVYIGLHVNLKLLNAAKNKVNNIYNSNNSVVLKPDLAEVSINLSKS